MECFLTQGPQSLFTSSFCNFTFLVNLQSLVNLLLCLDRIRFSQKFFLLCDVWSRKLIEKIRYIIIVVCNFFEEICGLGGGSYSINHIFFTEIADSSSHEILVFQSLLDQAVSSLCN